MKFKCIYTGLVYEFTTEHDIKAMKQHQEYVAVEEEVKEDKEEVESKSKRKSKE